MNPAQMSVAAPVRIHTRSLVQIAFCVVPTMTLVALEQFTFAAYYLFLVLGAMVLCHLISNRALEASTIAIGVIPAIMLLRGLFLYNSPQLVFACCLLCLCKSYQNRIRFARNKPLQWLCASCVLYWLISFLLTGEYSSNIRLVEFCLAAAIVFLLSSHRTYLASALCGVAISAVTLALGMLPAGGARLGIVSVSSDLSLGNPVTLGLAAALGYLLTLADRGSWMLLDRSPGWRTALNLAAGVALLLSTSRGSWLMTLVGLVIISFTNRAARRTLFACVGIFAVVIFLLLQTERGPAIQHYFDNAMSDDKSLDKRTTGRADQWENFPRVFDASPLWGFGPGSGKAVSLKYTKEGKVWHSLYLMIGTETGLIGLSALTLLLSVVFVSGRRHLKQRREIVPLLSLACFMVIGVSVSGMDAISGVFLGLAFTAGYQSRAVAVRAVSVPEYRENVPRVAAL